MAAISTLDLERLAVGAWVPDEVELRHGWMLRAADGFTGRGNSALVLADPGERLDDLLDDVVDCLQAPRPPAGAA